MTSQTTTTGNEQLFTPGRTVRDIVEYSPGLVNEVWCRKILRQVLQALETSYAKQQPHPAITADSIAMQANGDAVLLSTETLPVKNPAEPDDLRALAAVIHYAITQELMPQGPLRGRVADGYSDSLIGAVDRCMAADPRQRPQTIEQLRNLLGIVSVAPPVPLKPSAPAFTPQAASPSPAPVAPVIAPAATGSAGMGRMQRWLLIGAAASVLAVAAAGLYSMLQRDKSDDAVALALPPADASAGDSIASVPAVPTAPQPGPTNMDSAEAPAAAPAELVTLSPEEARGAKPATVAAAAEPEPASAEPVAAATTPPKSGAAASDAGTTYRLQVKPWATVYVNGVERGVSPPLKRLALPAGDYTVRLVNPNYPDRVIKLASGKSRSGTIAHNFAANPN